VIALGRNLEPASFCGAGSGVTLVNYAPQQEMLKRATLMITHGGLGSIKECIYFGVPMLVYPFDTDQPANAARVAFHGLGLTDDTHNASVEQILDCVKKVQSDPSYRSRVSDLSQKLRTSDSTSMVLELVNEVLNRKRANCGMSS
jgi:UDP:flavonoid glycosyltransferase YjiC (YdhE family)